MRSYIIKIPAVLFGTIILLSLLGGCSNGIIDNSSADSAAIDIAVKGLTSEMSAAVDSYRVVVTAPDLAEPIIGPLEFVNGFLVGVVIVPMGSDRLFTVQALDKVGTALYSGQATIDIGLGSVNQLDISLVPVVPMVYLTPHYQEVVMNDMFAVDIVVHDIPNLSSITIALTVSASPTYLYALDKGADLDDSSDVWWEGGTYDAAIGAYTNSRTNGIVDSEGNARIATLTLGSYADWNMDTASAFINFSINSMWSTSGDSIPINSVYTDGASIFLYKIAVGTAGVNEAASKGHEDRAGLPEAGSVSVKEE